MGCWKSKAKSQFDGWSGKYDRSILQRIFFRPSHDKLIETLSLRPNTAVLDVGCGTGRFLARMLEANPSIAATGLDLSSGMIEQAQTNLEAFGNRVCLIRGDSEKLPFGDNAFDAVTCVHSFHHYPHQGRVLREMHRVLKPGGQLVIVDANRDSWWGWLVFDGVVRTIEGLIHHCSAQQFEGLFESAGFEEIAQARSGRLAPFLVTSAIRDGAVEKTRRAA